MKPFEIYKHAGLTVELHYDESPSSPREWSNVGTMLVNYPGYRLGDGENDDEDGDFLIDCIGCGGSGHIVGIDFGLKVRDGVATFECDRCEGEGRVRTDPATYYRQTRGARVVLPLFVYEHSGITISSGPPIEGPAKRADVRSSGRNPLDGAGWDTSFVGFIFDTPEQVDECMGDVTDEQIRETLEQEVKIYADYLEGKVYGFIVKGPAGEDVDDLLSGLWGSSLWGVFDDYPLTYLKSEANEQAESISAQLADEAREVEHWRARDVETIG